VQRKTKWEIKVAQKPCGKGSGLGINGAQQQSQHGEETLQIGGMGDMMRVSTTAF
jgi:hypothetical protein